MCAQTTEDKYLIKYIIYYLDVNVMIAFKLPGTLSVLYKGKQMRLPSSIASQGSVRIHIYPTYNHTTFTYIIPRSRQTPQTAKPENRSSLINTLTHQLSRCSDHRIQLITKVRVKANADNVISTGKTRFLEKEKSIYFFSCGP